MFNVGLRDIPCDCGVKVFLLNSSQTSLADDDVNDRMVVMEGKYSKVDEIDRKLKELEG